jgi:hypothetical protein
LVGILLALGSAGGTNAAVAAPGRLVGVVIAPEVVLLEGPRSEQALAVTGRYDDGTERDLTGRARLAVADDAVVALDEETATAAPRREGETRLTATFGGQSAAVPVRVLGLAKPPAVSFRNEVMPVLASAGCSQAACHGAQAGKGGFKLSLFGYDPAADYQALAGGGQPPRIDRAAPAASRLLLKATMAEPHGGGLRFTPGSLPYRVLRDWIAGGAPVPGDGPALARLAVTPAERLAPRAGQPQRLLARAVYSDGSERDVTSLARYDAVDPDAVEVTAGGTVTPLRPGAAVVMVRYGGQVARFQGLVPFAWPLPAPKYPRPENAIDRRAFARLGQLGLPLSPPASDLEFLRRVSLDLAGTLPTPDEIRGFLAECAAEPGAARERLIDALLQREEHRYFWAQKWSDLFKVNSRDLGPDGMFAYYRYFLEAVQTNKPWDRLARELLVSQPGTGPAGGYYLTALTPEERAASTAEVFLGARIQCAQCHHHPFERWSQDDFWQFAAFFARVPSPRNRGGVRALGRPAAVPVAGPQELIHPRTKQPVFPPKPLDAPPVLEPDAGGDRREPLAAWLTAPDNPWFARAFVNRVWKHFFGRGIVDPVDDLRDTNPPSDPALLDALAAEFRASGCDARALIRSICRSRVYQTTSRPLPGNAEDTRFFSHAGFRRLTAEQLADAIAQATGVPDEYPGFERGVRAIQLPDPEIAAPFLDAFGRPGRTQACECERVNDPSVGQALQLITGPVLSVKAAAGNGRIARLLFFTTKAPDEIWEELYLWTVSRPPTGAERQAWHAHLSSQLATHPENQAGTTQAALEDWFWALLNSKEFLFNH